MLMAMLTTSYVQHHGCTAHIAASIVAMSLFVVQYTMKHISSPNTTYVAGPAAAPRALRGM